MKLDDEAVAEADAILRDLFGQLETRREVGHGEHVREVGLDMRYAGQEHSLTVPISTQDGEIQWNAEQVRAAFTEDYRRTFAHEMDEDVQIVSVRATVRTPLPRIAHRGSTRTGLEASGSSSVEGYSFERGSWETFALVERSELETGDSVAGPAIVVEETTTTYLDAGFTAVAHSSGSLLITGAAS
jgi:N-methylhydantoinase A